MERRFGHGFGTSYAAQMVQGNFRYQPEPDALGQRKRQGKKYLRNETDEITDGRETGVAQLVNVSSQIVSNPLINSIFLLRVDAVYDLACTKVSGIVQEKEYENIQEGGVNDYVVLREKPVSKPNVLQIEQYVGEQFFDPLPVGKMCAMPLVLYVGRYVSILSPASRIFTFSGCTVMSKEYGELDAEKSGLMTVSTKVAYQTVTVAGPEYEIPLPLWGFDPGGTRYQGIGVRNARINILEMRKAEKERMSRKWPEQRSARSVAGRRRG